MILLEDYELEYTLYKADSVLSESFMSLMLSEQVITESVKLDSIYESAGESIVNYITKIISGIQKVWNKFKEMF